MFRDQRRTVGARRGASSDDWKLRWTFHSDRRGQLLGDFYHHDSEHWVGYWNSGVLPKRNFLSRHNSGHSRSGFSGLDWRRKFIFQHNLYETTGNPPTTRNIVITFNANGSINGTIRANSNVFSAVTRITGIAGITYATVGSAPGFDDSGANSDGPVPYEISGFKQSDVSQ